MKKVFAITASLFFVIVAANAQTEKQKPPPPPPKPKEEVKYEVEKQKVENEKNSPPKVVEEKIKVKEPPPPPKPKEEVKYKIVEEKAETKEPPLITVTGKLADEFYEKNPTVSEISGKGNFITVKKKDGTSEIYDMSKKDRDKSFTEKYGRSPIPPPPPPPKKKVKA